MATATLPQIDYSRFSKNGELFLAAGVVIILFVMVPVKAWGAEQWTQRIHLMVGPFGFGKTTTALRFALHLRKSEPDARIAFINADCLRGNGRLTLRHWAELSNFTYMEAPDRAAMKQKIDKIFP